MAITTLASFNWGSGPKIPVVIKYDKRRSGKDMQYQIQVEVGPLTGAHHFGYPIYMDIKLDAETRVSGQTLKTASQSQWGNAIVYTSGWLPVLNKISGSTSLEVVLYSGNGSTRKGTYLYSLPVTVSLPNLSVPNGTIGKVNFLNLETPDRNVSVTITWSCKDENGTEHDGTIATVQGSSAPQSLGWMVPIDLANYIPTSTSIVVSLACQTYMDDVYIGQSTASATMSLSDNVVPDISTSLDDVAAGNLEYYGSYIKGKSRLRVRITGTGKYQATITKYRATLKSTATPNVTVIGVSDSNIFRPFNEAGEHTIVSTVTDSRGRTNSRTDTINVVDYTSPTVTSFTIERCNESGTPVSDGDYCKATFSARITALNNKNTAAYNIEHRLKGDASWESLTVAAAAGNYAPDNIVTIFAADADHVHEVRVTASDDFGSFSSSVRIIGIGIVLAQTTDDMTGLAFGRRALVSNTMDVNLNAILRKGLSSYDSITFDEGEQTAERAVVFKNDAGENPHNCALYGGNPSSKTGIGMYDRKNAKSVFIYDDVNSKVSLGDGGMDLLLTGKTVEFQGPLHVLGGATYSNHISNAPTGYSGYGRGILFGDPTSKDRYYLLIDSNGKLWTGTALGNATTITWREK